MPVSKALLAEAKPLVPAIKAFLRDLSRQLGTKNRAALLASLSSDAGGGGPVEAGRIDFGSVTMEPLVRKLAPLFEDILKSEGISRWTAPAWPGRPWAPGELPGTPPPTPPPPRPQLPAGAPGRGPSGSEFYVGAWSSWRDEIGMAEQANPTSGAPTKPPKDKKVGAWVWQKYMNQGVGGWSWQDADDPNMDIVTSESRFGDKWLARPATYPTGLVVPAGYEPKWITTDVASKAVKSPDGISYWAAYALFPDDSGEPGEYRERLGVGSGKVWRVSFVLVKEKEEEDKKLGRRSPEERAYRDGVNKAAGKWLGSPILGIIVSALLAIMDMFQKEGGDPAGILLLLLGVVALGTYNRLKSNLQKTATGTALAKR